MVLLIMAQSNGQKLRFDSYLERATPVVVGETSSFFFSFKEGSAPRITNRAF
jgi:hypothetical protein